MNVLIITGPIWPKVGNNSNLLSKVLPYLTAEHSVELLSAAFGSKGESLPESFEGCPIHWARESSGDWKQAALYPLIARIKKEPGFEGEFGARLIESSAKAVRKTFPYDAILCTMQPYAGTLAASRIRRVHKVVYLMDPPDFVFDSLPWEKTQKQLKTALRHMDRILTTVFIREALSSHADLPSEQVAEISFPHIAENAVRPADGDLEMPADRINLLYCGALFPTVRDPACFLRMIEQMDERFCVTLIGRNCDQFWKKYAVPTRADVRAYSQMPYQVAVNAMERADVLINIGNNMKIHMPSKTLDYINTGKPIVNFHKFADCPTLHFTSRYPLCLNLYEPEMNDRDAGAFFEFCAAARGRRVSRQFVETTYEECTPRAVADTILNALERS